jgi:hypothetical protein
MSATGYKLSTGADLNTVFAPYVSGTPAAVTGYQNATGADLNTLFAPYVSGTQAAATGYQISGGADLNAVFRIPGWIWNAVGTGLNGTVRAIAVLDASNIFVGGSFTAAGATSVSNIARWNSNNNAWTALGSGTNGQVNAISVLDSSNIFVGGSFSLAGGLSNAKFVAKWNNNTTAWSTLTSGLSKTQTTNLFISSGVYSIACLNSTNVFIGGAFDTCNDGTVTSYSYCIMRWNNNASSWSNILNNYVFGGVLCIAILDAANIFISGAFSNVTLLGGCIGIFKYNNLNGTASAIGNGVANSNTATTQPVWSISILDSSNIFVGGVFANATREDTTKVPNTTNIARWNNNTQIWSAVGSGMLNPAATNAAYSVYNICAVDTSTIFVGGNFLSVNGITNTSYMAMWNNNTSTWLALSEKPNNNVWSCCKFNNTTIFVGGDFTASGNITNKISKYEYL